MKNFCIAILAVFLASCGSGAKTGPIVLGSGGGGAQADSPAVQQIVAQAAAGAPVEAGDSQSSVYDDYYELDADHDCEYQISENFRILRVVGDSLEMEVQRTSSPLPGNSALCAATFPNLVRDQALTASRDEYKVWNADHILRRISPPRILERNPSLQSAEILSVEDVTHLKSRAKKVEIKLVGKSGRHYRQTTYISVDLSFLGVLEFSRRDLETSHEVSFFRTTAYRAAGGRLVYP